MNAENEVGCDNFLIVLNGEPCAATKTEAFEVLAGQVMIVHRGEWMRSTAPPNRRARNIFFYVCPYFLLKQFTGIRNE